MTIRLLAALGAALALVACGGGGGGGVSQPIADIAPIVSAAGGEPLSLSSSQIKAELSRRVNTADTLLGTDIYDLGGYQIASTACSGTVCQVSILGNTVLVALSDLDFNAGTYESVMTRNGVSIVQGAGRATEDGITSESLGWGGWLDHAAFLIAGEAATDTEGYGLAGVYGLSFGDATGSVPVSGSASWRGVMAGYHFPRDEGHQGDATLTADFASSSIDVAFTNVRDVETGAQRASFGFNDVPLSGAGFTSRVGGRIEGAFYGPNHAEVGGIFEHGSTIGAFGAKRQ